MIARYDLQKDHENLFEALSKIKNIPYKCILIGDKISQTNRDLLNLIDIMH